MRDYSTYLELIRRASNDVNSELEKHHKYIIYVPVRTLIYEIL